MQQDEDFLRCKRIAEAHGARCLSANHSVIEWCRFVLTYCSTFCVDCFVRGVRVAQFAPGYFDSTPAVTYTNRTLPDEVRDTTAAGRKLADFLIWRYCFSHMQSADKWEAVFRAFADAPNDVLFPLPEALSYAQHVLEGGK
jgi:hypothetical protein